MTISRTGQLKRCTGWHRMADGSLEWRQWYTYENEPCPEHGTEFLVRD